MRILSHFGLFLICLLTSLQAIPAVITKVVDQNTFYMPKEVIKKAKSGTAINIYDTDGVRLKAIGRVESCSKFRCVVKIVQRGREEKIERGNIITRRNSNIPLDRPEIKKKKKKKKKQKKRRRKKKKKKKKKRRRRFLSHNIRAGIGPPMFMTRVLEYSYLINRKVGGGVMYGMPTQTPSKIKISGNMIAAKFDFSFSRPLYQSGMAISVYGGMMMVTLDFSDIKGADNHVEEVNVFFGGSSIYYNWRMNKKWSLRFGGGIQYNAFPASVTNSQTDEIKIPFSGINSTLEVLVGFRF